LITDEHMRENDIDISYGLKPFLREQSKTLKNKVYPAPYTFFFTCRTKVDHLCLLA